MMAQRFSDDAADKVRAVLVVSGMVGPRQTEAYVEACVRWYDRLPHADRAIANITADAYAQGDTDRAHLLANLLPVAPLRSSNSRRALPLRAERKKH
jgi:hypothetical protein